MRPADEAELAEAVQAARGALQVIGGGTCGLSGAAGLKVGGLEVGGLEVGGPEVGGLEVGGLSGIVLHEPGALTLVVRTGTPLADVEAVLAGERQRLAFEPPDWRALIGTTGEPTVGGMVAANASGPRRIQAGACRDALIGVRFVDGRGTVIRNGGRVMKNVTGLDLVKLMAGSYGTLGVLTQAAFKLVPVPQAAAQLVLAGLSDVQSVAAMARAMGSPFDVSGAARDADGVTRLRVEGFAGSVAYRAEALRRVLAEYGAWDIDAGADRVATDWKRLRDAGDFAGRAGDVWRVSVKPSDAPGLLDRIGADRSMLDWAGGLIWALVAPGTDVRARLGNFGGHATLLRAGPATRTRLPMFQPQPAALASLMRGLRSEFDPRGVFNPGLMD